MAPTEPDASSGAQSQRPVPMWPSACRVPDPLPQRDSSHPGHHSPPSHRRGGRDRIAQTNIRQAPDRLSLGGMEVTGESLVPLSTGVLSIASQLLSLTRKGPKTPLASASEAEGCGGSCLGDMGLGLRGRKENYQVGLDQTEESRQCGKVGISPLTSSQHPSTGGPGAA